MSIKRWIPIYIILTLFFGIFFLKDLPVPLASIDDLGAMVMLNKTPITKIIGHIFSSFPSSWRTTGHMDSVAIRPFTKLIAKIFVLLFGFKALPLLLFKAIIWSLTSAMVLLFVYRITKNKVFSLGAGLFYFLSPALGHNMIWSLGDLTILAQFLTSVSFYLFLKLYLLTGGGVRIDKTEGKRPDLLLIGIVIIGWLALKTKESATFLPLVIFLFLVLEAIKRGSLRNVFDRKIKLLSIFMFTVGLALLIPRLGGGGEGGIRICPEAWSNLFIWNRTGLWWPPERRISLLDPMPGIPTSLLGTFGFYLGWLFLLSLLGLILRKRMQYEDTGQVFYRFSVVWLAVISLFFFFVNGADFRYLVGPLVPSTIIVFSVFHLFSSSLAKGLKRLFYATFLLALAITVIVNLYYSITIRSVWGGFHIALYGMVKKMYADQYNEPGTTLKDLVEAKLWYRSEGYESQENIEWWKRTGVDLRLRNNAVATFGGYSDAPPTVLLCEKAVEERVAQFGHCYLMDRKREELANHSSERINLIKHDLPVSSDFLEKHGLKIELLGVFSSVRGGVYSKTAGSIRSKVLKKHPFIYFLYKIKPIKNGIP